MTNDKEVKCEVCNKPKAKEGKTYHAGNVDGLCDCSPEETAEKEFDEAIESHKTELGYCCACSYDLACMEERVEKAKAETMAEAIRLVEEKLKSFERVLTNLGKFGHATTVRDSRERVTSALKNSLDK